MMKPARYMRSTYDKLKLFMNTRGKSVLFTTFITVNCANKLMAGKF